MRAGRYAAAVIPTLTALCGCAPVTAPAPKTSAKVTREQEIDVPLVIEVDEFQVAQLARKRGCLHVDRRPLELVV